MKEMQMTYGYARVSTSEQNPERQIQELSKYISDPRYILVDKASGKDFKRPKWNSLVGTKDSAPMLHEGDMLIVTSIDRLGRNYTDIKIAWDLITNELKCDIKVLDMPLLNTSSEMGSLDRKFIVDTTLSLLSYVAEKERVNIKERQRQGIEAMPCVNGRKVSKRTNKPIGRPLIEYPSNWAEVYSLWSSECISSSEAMKELNVKKSTFYNLVRRYRDSKGNGSKI